MEKKFKKHEQTDKKTNVKYAKDQGDNVRRSTVEKVDHIKVFLPDRGDINHKTNQITAVKSNVNEKKKTIDQPKAKIANRNINEIGNKDAAVKKPVDKKATPHQTKTLDLEERRNIREKYTFRMKNNNNNNQIVILTQSNSVKNEKTADQLIKKPLNEETTQTKENPNEFKETRKETTSIPDVKIVKKPEKESLVLRRPIIKTITSKNDARIYKAVTFVDQKRQQPTSLQINIPSDTPKKHKSKTTEINTKAKVKPEDTTTVPVKEKPVNIRKKTYKKRYRKRRENISPETRRGAISPPTEVAKWAPSCLNHHTKPYYEAWVNTTLAAISKSSKNKSFLEKQSFIQSFQKALEERAESPDLVYEKIHDERYTGRIRVKHK